VGNNVGKTEIDDRWRITLPPDVREGLRRGQVVELEREGKLVVLKPTVDVGTFEAELEGCVRGSKVPPERLKEIWGIEHAHG
jgi:bifunctional DNA-binding transcriptional regulator/antitoxin component of YhaV-PrlF toxin-antitoxin module